MIRTDQLSYRIGDFRLHPFSLEIEQGQYFVLLGPPGSGKSLFLVCLCGLKQIESGRIRIDGRDVTDLEPRTRNIGYVPQDYALFPHLSVERNIAFGLRAHGIHRRTISSKVVHTAEMLGISHLLTRSINGLSGGERQCVALSRALVLQPKVLLLDEPVCALDEATRQDVCAQLYRIQRRLGLTTIHISHDLEEAFSVADQAGILHQGTLQQVGSMGQLFRRPRNEFVARFMRCENLFRGQAVQSVPSSQGTIVHCGSAQLAVPGQHQGLITFMIRPEDVLLVKPGPSRYGKNNEFPVKLIRAHDRGNYVRMDLKGPFDLVAHLPRTAFAELKAEHNSDLIVVLHTDNIHVLPG